MKTQQKLFLGMALFIAASSASAADLVKAKQNYDRYCAACHGFTGMSVMPDAPNLRLNAGLMQPDLMIVNKLKSGSAKKPPFVGLMSDQELFDVVTYARTIR